MNKPVAWRGRSLAGSFTRGGVAALQLQLLHGDGKVGPERRPLSTRPHRGSYPAVTPVRMSSRISTSVRARLYTRTSSITPWKNSPHGIFPPMNSGRFDVLRAVDTGVL